MHHLVLFVFLLSAAYSEIIEPKPQPSGVTLSPSYAQPGMNPSYTGPSQPSEVTSGSPGTVYGQTNPVQPTYNQESPAVYPAYGYPEYGYGYQPYPVKKNEESGMIKTLGAILPVIRVR